MPMFESSVAMMTSQQPSSEALPAKQRPELMATVGTTPLSRAIDANVGVTSGRLRKLPDDGSRPFSPVRLPPVPARPPPPSVKNTSGSRHALASSSMRSVFGWLIAPWVPARTV